MLLAILKYLFIIATASLWIFTIYDQMIDRGAWYTMIRTILTMVWLGYLGLLLVVAGIVYYYTQSVVIWKIFIYSFLSGVLVWSLIYGTEGYSSYKYNIILEQNKKQRVQYIKDLQKAYKENPNNPKTLTEMATAILYSNDISKYDRYPSDYFKKAIEIDPHYTPAYKALIGLCQNMKYKHLDKEKGFGDDESLYAQVGGKFSQKLLDMEKNREVNLPEEEKEYFSKAIIDAGEKLKSIENSKESQQVNFKRYLDDAIARVDENPKDAQAQAALAFVYYRYHDDYAHAYEEIQKALKLNPDLFSVQETYGYILEGMRLCKEAIDAYQKAIQISPEKRSTLEDNIEYCQHLLDWAGTSTDIYSRLFYYNYTRRSYNEFYKEKIREQYKKDPENPENIVKMGLIQYYSSDADNNKEDKGISYYEKAVKQTPDHIEAYMYLVAGYYFMHEFEKIKKISQDLLQKAKDQELKLSIMEQRFFMQMIQAAGAYR